MIERLGMDEDTPLEAGMLTKQIENAQKRVESRNFEIRKHVLQYRRCDESAARASSTASASRCFVGENMRDVHRRHGGQPDGSTACAQLPGER